MSLIVLGEYRNQHSQRNYPFLDTCTLKDTDGWTLPADFIIDAFLYPIDLENGLYISKIVRGERQIYFSDTVTDKVHGVAVIDDEDTSFVYEPDGLKRQIGVVTFGASKSAGLQGNVVREFLAESTKLTPTAFIPLNQTGVRGVKLDDGTVITGNVQFRGTDGVEVKSYYDYAGRSTLEFSIVGESPATDSDCFGCDAIQEICVHREPGSIFMVSELPGGTLAVDTYGITLDSICEAQKLIRLPNDAGALPPDNLELAEIPDGPSVDFCFNVVDFVYSGFYVVAPSTAGDWNPVSIRAKHSFGRQGNPRLRPPTVPSSNSDELDASIAGFRDPPDLGDALQIGLKGLPVLRRGKHA